jgi:hypothetical protein
MATSQGAATGSAPGLGSSPSFLSVTIEFSGERQTISGASLATSIDAVEPTFESYRTEAEHPTVSFEYIGNSLPTVGQNGSVSATIGGITVAGTGTCTSSSVRAAVGELIRGSATYRVKE